MDIDTSVINIDHTSGVHPAGIAVLLTLNGCPTQPVALAAPVNTSNRTKPSRDSRPSLMVYYKPKKGTLKMAVSRTTLIIHPDPNHYNDGVSSHRGR